MCKITGWDHSGWNFAGQEAAHIIPRSHSEFVRSLVNLFINTPVEGQSTGATPNGYLSQSRTHVHRQCSEWTPVDGAYAYVLGLLDDIR